MSLDLIITYLTLLLGMIIILFWLWILIKGIISRKIKLPYVWGLYFSISYIFFFSKRIISDTATERTISIIGILFLLMLWGIGLSNPEGVTGLPGWCTPNWDSLVTER